MVKVFSKKESNVLTSSTAKNANEQSGYASSTRDQRTDLSNLVRMGSKPQRAWISDQALNVPAPQLAGVLGKSPANPFYSCLPLAYALLHAGANEDAKRMHKDDQRNSANGDEVIAHAPFHALQQSRSIRESAPKISSTNACAVQRKGPYLNNFDEDVKKWLNEKSNELLKDLVKNYHRYGTHEILNHMITLNDLRLEFYKNRDKEQYRDCYAVAQKFLVALLDESDFVMSENAILEQKEESQKESDESK
jgi:hypothetical protein